MSEQNGNGNGNRGVGEPSHLPPVPPRPVAPMAPMTPMAPPVSVPTGPAPKQVVSAARLMWASAALGVVGVIVLLFSKNSIRSAVLKKNPSYDTDKLNTVVNAAVVTDVVGALLFVVLYVWLSRQLLKGRNWARMTALVFAGLGVLFGLLSLANPTAAATRVLELVTVVIDLGIIYFLVQKPSVQFFRPLR